ncbi:hypothetical protein AC579_2483 [Pseudocercospora musae]|uniref:Uncharacterized protein n=1 Tax=Pseudocercospora musae TaxID=113226 RepID=A0A139IET5_9PEZI|nr:hypothetical protein AC579_2483 [Pseudocercospora musae]
MPIAHCPPIESRDVTRGALRSCCLLTPSPPPPIRTNSCVALTLLAEWHSVRHESSHHDINYARHHRSPSPAIGRSVEQVAGSYY